MPDKTTTTAADPRDIQIKDLQAQVKSLQDEVNSLNEHADEISSGYEAELASLREGKAPIGDVVYIGGQAYPVITTIRAEANFDPVKKGYIAEGLTLVVISKVH